MPNIEAMRQTLKRIMEEEHHRTIWDSYCETCQEPLGGEQWAHVIPAHEDDADPRRVYYCTRCVTIDSSRQRRTGA